MKNKIDATILGIIYHPEIRNMLTDEGKKDIAKMVNLLVEGRCLFVECCFADKCNAMCDWAKRQCWVSTNHKLKGV